MLKQTGQLPVNIKVLLEGEEEIGSPNLVPFIQSHKEILKADVVFVSDTPMFSSTTPSICISLRGLNYYEIEVTGPKQDLHSGQHGGAVANPVQALAKIITDLKDDQGRVTIPGFYDDVVELSTELKSQLSELPFDETEYKQQLGVSELPGEKGYSVLERRWNRPTLDCNGFIGGYTGEGAKTIIPAKASAKVSMRLVANQDPQKITQYFEDYLKTLTPKGVEVSIKEFNSGSAAMMDITQLPFKAASDAVETVFNKKPVFHGEGGSIPIIAEFEKELGLQSILLGFNLPDDGIHGPNERFSLENYQNGILTVANFLQRYAQLSQK